jgi:hypothetical protein
MALWPRRFGRDAPTPPATAAPRRTRVFVSHAHQPPDLAALVREFALYLTGANFDVWFDELDIRALLSDHHARLAIGEIAELAGRWSHDRARCVQGGRLRPADRKTGCHV